MFFTMFFKTQNIGHTMHLTMLFAHPYAQFSYMFKNYFIFQDYLQQYRQQKHISKISLPY